MTRVKRKNAIGLIAAFIALSAGALLSLLSLTVNAGTLSSNVVANVVVSNTCFTEGTPALPSFAALVPTATDANTLELTDTDNGGNAQATFEIDGSAWTGPGSNTFGVGNTEWATSSGGAGTALTLSYVSTGLTVPAPNTVVTSTTSNVFLGLYVPGGTAAGNYVQTISIENSCGTGTTSTSVTANVVVQGVCYITLSTGTLNFGTLTPTATYNTNSVVTDTDSGGNAAAAVDIEGTNWQGPGSNTIPVGNTLYDSSSQSSYTGTALTSSLIGSGVTVPAPNAVVTSQSASLYFGLGVPGGTSGGTYTQNILIENSC